MFQGLFSDCRHAVRLYRRTPLQSVFALIVVAVGVAFSVSFFSLYSSLALQAMPGVGDDSRLVSIGTTDGEQFNPSGNPNEVLLDAILERSSQLTATAGAVYLKRPAITKDVEQEVTIAAVSSGYFSGLNLPLYLGRGLDETDHAESGRVVVLSHEYWLKTFDGDAEAIDRRIQIAGTDFRIVGISSPGFSGFDRGMSAEIFIPSSSLVADVLGFSPRMKDILPLNAVGRLSSDATPLSANSELTQLSDTLRQEFPDLLRGVRLEALAQLDANPYVLRDAERRLAWFVVAAALLMLVATTNLSLFFLARAPGRCNELFLRRSVGATQGRMFRQLLTETSVLVFAGTMLGVMIALWLAIALQELPVFEGVNWRNVAVLDWRVLLFSIVIASILSFACATAPHWSVSQGTGRLVVTRTARVGNLQQAVTIVQIVIATVVLTIGVLFTQTALTGMIQPQAFATDSITIMELDVIGDDWRPNLDATQDFRRAVRERIHQADPEARVAFSDSIPMIQPPRRDQVSVSDGREPEIRSRVARVDPAWFDVLSIAVLNGRVDQMTDPGVAAVNTRFAEAAWGSTDIVGKTVTIPDGGPIRDTESSKSSYRIVAVTEAIRYGHPANDAEPAVYIGYPHLLAQIDPIYISSSLAGDTLVDVIQPALSTGAGDMEVAHQYPFVDALQRATAPDRARGLMTAGTAVLVVALAVMGFFGTLRFMVDSGRFEFALRAAVGASPSMVFRHVFNRGLVIAVPGLAFGVLMALLALDATFDYFDIPAAMPVVAVGLAVVAMAGLLALAITMPACRAARVQTGPVLRED